MIGSFLDSDKDKLSRDILSDITVHMKYARYLHNKKRYIPLLVVPIEFKYSYYSNKHLV